MVGIMLAQRRRWWPSITLALGQCIVVSGVSGAGIESVTRITLQHTENIVQSPNAVSMSVVEGIHVGDIFKLVYLVLSLIISWTFRILAHEVFRNY